MVVGGRDTFTDQHRIGAGPRVILEFNTAKHAGFRDFDDIIRQIAGKFLILADIHLKILEIAGVDADDLRPRMARTVDFLTRMGFDQCGHAQIVGELHQLGEAVIVKRRDDEEHQIRSMRPGFPDLVFIGDEVLAQHRNMHGLAHLVEIDKAAEESTPFRQHGDCACSPGLVFACQRGRIGNIGQMPFGRRCAFDFRDDRYGIGAFEPFRGVKCRRPRLREPFELIERRALRTFMHVLCGSCHKIVKY